MLNTPFHPWPNFTLEEADAVQQVLLSNKVNYWTGTECREFEKEFAMWCGSRHAVALANGTLALDVALKALRIVPADGAEIVKTVNALVHHEGPVFVRLTGVMNNPVVYREEYDFTIGKAVELRDGKDIAIFACGTMVHESLVAARELEEQGISAGVVNMHTVKPLDVDAVEKACTYAKLLVTIEEHSTIGGAVAEYTARRGGAPRQVFIGLPDSFGRNGDYKYLLQKYGLTGEQIARNISDFLCSSEKKENIPVPTTAIQKSAG